MARTIYIRPVTRARMDQHKPPSWSLADYLEFLSLLHSDMDELEKAQQQYSFQLWLSEQKERQDNDVITSRMEA